jgi:integrase
MASVHKQPGRPYWFCSYATGTGLDRQRHFKSTKTANKKAALEICRAWEQTARVGGTGKLTPETAREIVARGVADIFTAVNAETMPSASVRTWCRQWLEAKEIEAEPATVTRYGYAIDHFLKFLGTKAERDIASIRPADVTRFRDQQARLSRATANLGIKVLRACFNTAVKQGLLTGNPATVVDQLKQRGESKRRAFTLDELRRVLDAAKGSDWYGATLTSLYTGARLSDTARLTWRAVDLQQNTLAFVAKKTGKRVLVPLAKPLADHLATLPSNDDPSTPLFPRLAKLTVSHLSDGFRCVLVDAGMADPRSHDATGKGRNAARPVAELSFHSLRHSFVSILKSTGANEAVAMALAGHETKAVSQNYTHLDAHTLRAAVDKMTDVTKATKTKAAKV